MDDDELWARWTSNWPRWPKGVTEDGEAPEADPKPRKNGCSKL